jgi:hypothetical protein
MKKEYIEEKRESRLIYCKKGEFWVSAWQVKLIL